MLFFNYSGISGTVLKLFIVYTRHLCILLSRLHYLYFHCFVPADSEQKLLSETRLTALILAEAASVNTPALRDSPDKHQL